MENEMCKIQSRLHACSAGSIVVEVYRGYRYKPTTYTQDILYTHTGNYRSDRAMFAGRSRRRRRSPWSRPFWFKPGGFDGDKRPPRGRYGWTRGSRTVFQRSSLARGVSSRSLNPHSNVRENIARLMICVTHVGRGCADRQPASQSGSQAAELACLPACLLANPPTAAAARKPR